MHKVIQASVTQYGHWLTQNAFAYEVRMTSKKPDAKWRTNHVIMAIAKSVEDAIAMCVAQYPDDPIIAMAAAELQAAYDEAIDAAKSALRKYA